MGKPYIHAKSSARRFGGVPEDYLEIHTFMDSSKSAIADNRHRALTHTSWFLMNVLERVKFSNSCKPTPDNRFTTIENSDGRIISVRSIGEQHILEDFGMKYIPSASDYLGLIDFETWMQNGVDGVPMSSKKLYNISD